MDTKRLHSKFVVCVIGTNSELLHVKKKMYMFSSKFKKSYLMER